MGRTLRNLAAAAGFDHDPSGQGAEDMAKGQMKSNKEMRKPKKEVKKTIAANPSTKGTPKRDDD